MAWGALVVALWMGLIGGMAATAHADPAGSGGSGGGKSTTQSAKGADKSSKSHDKATRPLPRKVKPHRLKDHASLEDSTTTSSVADDKAPVRERPTAAVPRRSGVRDAVDDVTARIRRSMTDIADRTPKVGAVQSIPRTATLTRPEVPDLRAMPAIADVIDTFTHQPEVKPIAEVNTLVDRIATQPIVKLASATVGTPLPAPRSVPVVNIIGSLVFNVVGAALQVFSGSPVLPAGSNVTVRTSTLTMPGSGQSVRADWYFPKDPDSATGVIYLQHGFMATGPMYSYTAAYLAEETNSIVVVPTLSSNLFDAGGEWIGGEPMQQSVADLFVGDRPELTASASAAAGHPVTLPSEFVLVGHSLGGMLVTGAAGRMVDNGAVNDLQGVVLLDAVDTHNDMPAALAELSGDNYRPVLLISSERYVWNLDGTVGDELQAARPGQFNGVTSMPCRVATRSCSSRSTSSQASRNRRTSTPSRRSPPAGSTTCTRRPVMRVSPAPRGRASRSPPRRAPRPRWCCRIRPPNP